MAWSKEFLPSNPGARVRFPAGSGILIAILGLGVSFFCVLYCVVSGGDPDNLLPTDSGRSVLVYLSYVLGYSLWLLPKASDPRVFGL